MSEPLALALRARFTPEVTTANTLTEFLDAPWDSDTVAFLDNVTLEQFGGAAKALDDTVVELTPPGPVVAICDGPLQTAIGWLRTYPWLSHVVSAAMLQHSMAVEHLDNVVSALSSGQRPRLLDWLGPEVQGRRIHMTQSSRRAERLERMGDFFASKNVSSRTIDLLRDAAEELLTNAFYDAPVAAGVVKKPIPRTQEVWLPPESGCDMVYGCSDDLAVVRVRDPFGSLSRTRVVEVLNRCARKDMQVEVDESMGGAGLGLWRIVSVASFVAISVVSNHHTDFLVGIGKRPPAGPRPFAFHLFFKEAAKRRYWKLQDDDPSKQSFANSITIVTE
jgi:hypothetical protein